MADITGDILKYIFKNNATKLSNKIWLTFVPNIPFAIDNNFS